MNDVREWLQENIHDKSEETGLQSLLDELTSFPVGVGRGSLYVDMGFVISVSKWPIFCIVVCADVLKFNDFLFAMFYFLI